MGLMLCGIVGISGVFGLAHAHDGPHDGEDEPYAQMAADAGEGQLARLHRFVGSYAYDYVLNDPYVKKELERMLGDKVEHLKENLKTQASIDFSGGCLVLSGNAPKQGTEQSALLMICTYSGDIHVVIYEEDRAYIYTKAERYAYLPHYLKWWVQHNYALRTNQYESYQPAYVRLVNPPESENEPDLDAGERDE